MHCTTIPWSDHFQLSSDINFKSFAHLGLIDVGNDALLTSHEMWSAVWHFVISYIGLWNRFLPWPIILLAWRLKTHFKQRIKPITASPRPADSRLHASNCETPVQRNHCPNERPTPTDHEHMYKLTKWEQQCSHGYAKTSCSCIFSLIHFITLTKFKDSFFFQNALYVSCYLEFKSHFNCLAFIFWFHHRP